MTAAPSSSSVTRSLSTPRYTASYCDRGYEGTLSILPACGGAGEQIVIAAADTKRLPAPFSRLCATSLRRALKDRLPVGSELRLDTSDLDLQGHASLQMVCGDFTGQIGTTEDLTPEGLADFIHSVADHPDAPAALTQPGFAQSMSLAAAALALLSMEGHPPVLSGPGATFSAVDTWRMTLAAAASERSAVAVEALRDLVPSGLEASLVPDEDSELWRLRITSGEIDLDLGAVPAHPATLEDYLYLDGDEPPAELARRLGVDEGALPALLTVVGDALEVLQSQGLPAQWTGQAAAPAAVPPIVG